MLFTIATFIPSQSMQNQTPESANQDPSLELVRQLYSNCCCTVSQARRLSEAVQMTALGSVCFPLHRPTCAGSLVVTGASAICCLFFSVFVMIACLSFRWSAVEMSYSHIRRLPALQSLRKDVAEGISEDSAEDIAVGSNVEV